MLLLPQVYDAKTGQCMELYSANRYAVNTNAESRNAATKCDGRMNAAHVKDKNANAEKLTAATENALNVNATNTSAENKYAGNRENETARNYASLNTNATNTNAGSATEIITNANGSNLSAEKNAGATRKPSMTFSAIFSDTNKGRRMNHEINL